jgi:AraC-like DNA-binding protein
LVVGKRVGGIDAKLIVTSDTGDYDDADQTGTPIAELSLDQIGRRAGVSRSTIYRRVRSRQAFDDAGRQAGGDPGSRVNVRDRSITVATELMSANGVAALTVDGVARQVGCSVSSVHTCRGALLGPSVLLYQTRRRPIPCRTPSRLGSGEGAWLNNREGG